MIDSIIHFSIKNKLVIFICTLALIGWGGYSLTRLPIDAVPDITTNQVQIITISPALGAQEVEKFITAPLEIAFANIPNQIEIRSISRSGLSVITVVFKDEADIYRARQLVSEQIKMAQGAIPTNMGMPELAPVTTGLGEIYQYVIDVKPGFEGKYSLADIRTIQDWIVKRQLAGTEGVAEISSFGGDVKQYEVSIDPEKLRAMNVSLTEIFDALANNNENTGGSYIEKNHNAYFIRAEGLVKNLADIENIVVRSDGFAPILIKDLANVQFGNAVKYGAMSKNGKGEVVGGVVLMLKGSNSDKVIQNVEARIVQIQKSLPEGLKITAFINRAELIERAIHTVEKNLLEGGLIVIFVLVLLLGNFRAGLVVASVIPLALLFALGMMNWFGVSANLMSLGAIDFGLVVDGAVIIVEAVVHHIAITHSHNSVSKINQDEMDETVYQSTIKIRHSAAFGEIIILMVYLPILALSGIEGKMFKPMAQTVSFAILGALILSLTYVPMASALFLSKKLSHKESFADKIMNFLYRFYKPALVFALRLRWTLVGITFAVFVGSIFLFGTLGGEFLPSLAEGNFAVEVRLAPGSSLTQSLKTFKEAERIVSKYPEVKQVVSRIGSPQIPTDPMPMDNGDLMIILKDPDEWTSAKTMPELAEKMSASLSELSGVTFDFLQPIQMRTNELISGVRADVGIKLFGDDLAVLFRKANECTWLIKNISGVNDLKVEQIDGQPQMTVTYNRDRISQYGLNIKTLNTLIRTSFAGEIAGVVYEGESRFDLVVRLDPSKRKDITDLSKIYIDVPAKNGVSLKVPLEEVATITYKDAPIQVSRENSKRRISITFNVRGRDVESTVNEVQAVMDKQLKIPSGYYYTFGGQFENLIEAKKRLSIAVPVALFMIFVLLFFTFHSFTQSLMIFSAIPLSAIGGIVALWMRGMYFSISAGIGFIALFGVAVLNGIVLIGYINQLEKEGIKDVYERIIKATEVRFRPVIMTAMVASLGFLPMALSSTAGAEVQKPLATVVIGGLISATLLTLIILPVIYSLTAEGFPWLTKFFKPKTVTTVGVIALLGFTAITTQAQSQTTVFTLDDAVNAGLQNSQLLKSSGYLIDEQRYLIKAAIDIPKTLVDLQYGKVQDPRYNDYTITALQQFAFPTLYSAQKSLAKSNVNSAEKRLEIDKNSLVQNIRLVYYQLLYNYNLSALLKQQDTVYSFAQKAASIRYKTGETNNLEKISAMARSQEVKNRIEMIDADIAIQKANLRRLLNITVDSIDIATDSPLKRTSLDLEKFKTQGAENNPTLRFLEQQKVISGKMSSVEKNKILPTLTAGYFYQTILHTTNNHGLFAGIGIPLWFSANQGRIQAAKVYGKAVESQLQYNRLQISGEMQIQLQQIDKLLNSISYFEKYALPQANEIIDNANKSYKNGELDYVEFVQAIVQAWLIKENYLTTVQAYNQTVILVEALAGF